MTVLQEDRRNELISKGRRGEREKGDGKTRYEKRVNSKVASTVKEMNQIDMQSLFKYGILTVNIPVRGETDNYLVRIKFGGFLEELHKRLKNSNNKFDLKTVTRALIDCFDREDVYIHCTCLYSNTKIKLTDGTTPTVLELLDRYNKGEDLYTYSKKGNKLIENKITKVWVTGRSKKFLRIVFSKGKEVITTPDHLYLVRKDTYLPASSLYVGQRLANNVIIRRLENITLLDEVPVYDIKMEGIPNFLTEAGAILHNCPDWKYRMAFWASMSQITSGAPENRPSKITNPKNTLGPGCKHVMLVLSNNKWVLKVASTIYNYINYMEKNRKQQYADIIYPAIYDKKYEEPVQLSIDDSDTLSDDKDIIDTANVQGRTRGQFKTGNPYRFQKKPGVGVGQIPIQDEEE